MVEHIATETVTPVWCLPDEDPAVPMHERHRRAQAFRMGCLRSLDTDCEQIKVFCETWRNKELYRDFAPTWDGFCIEVLEVEPAWIDKVCEGLRVLRAEGHTGSVSVSLAEQAADTEALRETRGAPKGNTNAAKNNCDYITIENEQAAARGSTGRTYLLARLKRDAPEIFARVEAGEFTSARAAAKAAGIVHDPTPLDQLHKYWRKVSEEDRLRFLIEMLTPAERRVISTGLFPEEPTP